VLRRSGVALLAPLLGATGCWGAPASEPPLTTVYRWCVTSGDVLDTGNGGRFVDVDAMRAVASAATAPAAELRFTYVGPTADTSMLDSGAVRRQVGLKLLAANSCNVLYVMWRLDPVAELGAECGDQGYRTLRPIESGPLPAVVAGEPHVLHAALVGAELTVTADGALVFRGRVPAEGTALEGPVGVRTDNGRFALALAAPAGNDNGGGCPRGDLD
jgi:hypothetical protein